MTTKTKITSRLKLLAVISGLFVLIAQTAVGQVYDPTKDKVTGTEPIATPTPGVITDPDPIAKINAEIEAKKKQIEDLRQQASTYEQKINSSLKEVQTLQSQLAIIDNQLAFTDLDIRAKEGEIHNFELEMGAIQIALDQKTTAINSRKQELAAGIKELDENARTTTLALIMSDRSLAEFYSQAQAVAAINDSLQQSITSLNRLRDELQAKQDQLAQAKDDVVLAKQELDAKRQASVEEKKFKDGLAATAKRSYNQYQQLYQGVLDGEERANSTIAQLQSDLQARLRGQQPDQLPSFAGFIWPARGELTAYFLDPTYSSYFGRPHYGIDIDIDQGTPVRAPADGKVGKIIEPVVGGLSVVQLIHGGGFVTYYLHLSKIFLVPEQTVKQGDVIGLSGGIPGTAGAGPSRWYSTGDHLHFEIWKQDATSGLYKPDDPLKYLP